MEPGDAAQRSSTMREGELFAGRCRIVRFVARGGMGEVYEAHDETLEATVALKRVSFAGLPDDEAATARAHVLREARLAARLRGVPEVVATYDVVPDGDDVWLVLEYVPSTTLADAVTDRLDPIEVARIGAAVATALAAAHAADVLHRDVKPGNVLLGHDGSVKLTDFGISRGTGEATKLTATDVVSGTPAYMAREVARGEDPSPASDVYALGATLYRAVEGVPPHGTDGNALRLMYRVATEPPRPPEHADTLAPLLLRLLADDPTTRPDAATAAELLAAHARRPSEPTVRTGEPAPPSSGNPTLHGEPAPPAPPSRRRVWPLAAAAAAVLVATGVLVAVGTGGTDPLVVPQSVAARRLDVPPAQADPCPLLDADALARYGTVTLGHAYNPSGCTAGIVGTGGTARLSAQFQVAATAPPSGAATTSLGGASLARVGPSSNAGGNATCARVLTIADGTQIRIDGTLYGLTGVAACDLAEAGAATAARAVDRDGITANPLRAAAFRFVGRDACSVLSASDLVGAVPDVVVSRSGNPGFAAWSCSWGSGQILLYFGVDDPPTDDYGTARPVAGRPGWNRVVGTGCRAFVMYDEAAAGRPAQLVSVLVSGGSTDLQCDRASALASTAA